MPEPSKKEQDKLYSSVFPVELEHMIAMQKSDAQIVSELSEILKVGFDEALVYADAWYLKFYEEIAGITYSKSNLYASPDSIDEMVRRAVSEAEAQTKAVYKYVNPDQITRVMPSASKFKKAKLTRMDVLMAHIDISLSRQSILQVELLGEYLTLRSEYEIMRTANLLGKAVLPPLEARQMATVITELPFHGERFSDRIWRYKELLRKELEKGIMRSLIGGENPKDWAETLQRAAQPAYQANAKAHERLAITESGRAQVTAQMDLYKKYDVEYYMVICLESACGVCKPHDGQFYTVENAVQGINSPMFHPYCRCSTSAYNP